MDKQQIKDLIQEAWNEGKGRQPDTFGAFLDAAADKILASLPQDKAPVRVVCFCGSSRFTSEMMTLSWLYAKEGVIAIGWFVRPVVDGEPTHHLAELDGVAELFDELHLRKIDMSDEVHVVNVGGYIGDSTRREIAYAEAHGKPVKYLYSNSPIHHEVVPGIGWVAPDHPLHPDHEYYRGK